MAVSESAKNSVSLGKNIQLQMNYKPFGAVVTTCKNMVTRTKNKVTNKPARSPPFKGMKKLIQETTTNIAEGIINCKTKLKALRSRMT